MGNVITAMVRWSTEILKQLLPVKLVKSGLFLYMTIINAIINVLVAVLEPSGNRMAGVIDVTELWNTEILRERRLVRIALLELFLNWITIDTIMDVKVVKSAQSENLTANVTAAMVRWNTEILRERLLAKIVLWELFQRLITIDTIMDVNSVGWVQSENRMANVTDAMVPWNIVMLMG